MARTSLIITYRVVLVCFTWLFMSLGPTQSAPESALITQIPGFSGTIPSKHYSGYSLSLFLQSLKFMTFSVTGLSSVSVY